MDKVYYIFCILYGKNPLTRVPINTFISKNHENAKLYFQGYILGEKQPENYILYQIAEINKNLKIKETKIFICGGYEANRQQKIDNTKIKQTKLNFEKIKDINKENTIEIIEKLFEGKKI